MVAGRPAFWPSALMAAGVMSGVPVICSALMLSITVLRPLTPMKMATTPNAIRTAPATNPPISNSLRISVLLLADRLRCGRPLRLHSLVGHRMDGIGVDTTPAAGICGVGAVVFRNADRGWAAMPPAQG